MLDEIGFEFDPFSKAWEDMYEKLVEYKEEYGNIIFMPQHYTPCPGLVRWVWRQRRKRKLGMLSEERIQALDLLGFLSNLKDH
jgi:Helicase associated domain